MNKVKFKLNCGPGDVLGFIEAKRQPGVEKGRCDAGGIELFLTGEERGVKIVEYVYSAKMDGRELVGKVRSPSENENRPGALKSALLAVLGLILLGATFAVVFLVVMLFARNWLLSLYIALPLFGGSVAVIALAAGASSHKRKHVANLKKYFAEITLKK